jgi:hypothetical protein
MRMWFLYRTKSMLSMPPMTMKKEDDMTDTNSRSERPGPPDKRPGPPDKRPGPPDKRPGPPDKRPGPPDERC